MVMLYQKTKDAMRKLMMKRIQHFFLLLVFSAVILVACKSSDNWSLEKNHLVIKNDTGMTEWICFLNSTPEEEWGSILDSIYTITLKNGVTVIQGAAFEQCHNLTEVYMANSVHTIEEWAFDCCNSLRKVHWSKNLKIIEEEAFTYCALEEISFPEGVLEIQANAFLYCNELKRVVIPGSTYLITGVMEAERLEQLVFLGNRPERITNIPFSLFGQPANTQSLMIYYLNRNSNLWAPNGETEWNGIPIIGIDSLDDLPPLE